jgi:hypothetical protein
MREVTADVCGILTGLPSVYLIKKISYGYYPDGGHTDGTSSSAFLKPILVFHRFEAKAPYGDIAYFSNTTSFFAFLNPPPPPPPDAVGLSNLPS